MNENPIATRRLTATADGNPIDVIVRLYSPRHALAYGEWQCIYEIQWLDNLRHHVVGGVDAGQALLLAMNGIAAELYAGAPSRLRDLQWIKAGEGYGFPLPPSLKGFAQGEDR